MFWGYVVSKFCVMLVVMFFYISKFNLHMYKDIIFWDVTLL
jgi:hypothetical protein